MVGDPVNVSREFRTLVTAICAPLEEELADRAALPPARRDRLKALHRNIMRLLQLVNTLFDLSRIDPGRCSSPELVDLAAKTVVIPMLRGGELAGSRALAPHEPSEATPCTTELERANQELEAFSYSVSHDLRGPLRAIDGFSQVLLGNYAGALDRNGRDLLEQIHLSAQRMSAIVDDLLALSQVGRSELHRESVDLTVIARRVLANLRLREPSRVVDLSLGEGMVATGDIRLVTIALENLLSNAWKFTGKRPCGEIAFDCEDGGVFAVRDNGAGFGMDHSARLFEPFQRLHSTSEFEGTGIGLAIVKRVIERHGGRIWACGVVDRGATFRFTLEPGTS
jgi:signal transduction histidine kinase